MNPALRRAELTTLINRLKLTEVEAMNWLQAAGAVSDNCVHASDIARQDLNTAVQSLKQNGKTCQQR